MAKRKSEILDESPPNIAFGTSPGRLRTVKQAGIDLNSPNPVTFNVEQEESIRMTQVSPPRLEQIKGKHSARNDKKNLTLASQRGNHNKVKQAATMSMVKERNDNVNKTVRSSLPNELY